MCIGMENESNNRKVIDITDHPIVPESVRMVPDSGICRKNSGS